MSISEHGLWLNISNLTYLNRRNIVLRSESFFIIFEYQSGTSIKWKPKVSSYADKTLKSILHLAAMSVIRLNNDLARYYKRKVQEGKNKMSVLNAIRNKIIHRVFAVIKNQKKYNFDLVMS